MKFTQLRKYGFRSSVVAWMCTAHGGCTATPMEPAEAASGSDSGVPVGASTERTASSEVLFGGDVSYASTQVAATTSSATSDGPVQPPITACAKSVADGDAPMIDDFEDGDQMALEQDGRDGGWYFYDDGTRGSRQVNFDVDASGQRAGTVLSVAGSGFSDWGSGFGVGFNWNNGQCTYDASVYTGVQFWARGAGTTRITLQNLSVRPLALGGYCPTDASCFDSHGVSFEIPSEWTLMQLPFSAFSQAGWGTPVGPLLTDVIYLMEFQFGIAQPFLLELDDVAFFTGLADTDAGATENPDATVSSATDTTSVETTGTGPSLDAGTASSSTPRERGSDASSSHLDPADAAPVDSSRSESVGQPGPMDAR